MVVYLVVVSVWEQVEEVLLYSCKIEINITFEGNVYKYSSEDTFQDRKRKGDVALVYLVVVSVWEQVEEVLLYSCKIEINITFEGNVYKYSSEDTFQDRKRKGDVALGDAALANITLQYRSWHDLRIITHFSNSYYSLKFDKNVFLLCGPKINLFMFLEKSS